MYSLGVLQTIAFTLGPRVSESAYKLFKSSILVAYDLLDLSDVSSVDFQRQTFWGPIFLVHVTRFGMLDVGHKVFTPQEEALDL